LLLFDRLWRQINFFCNDAVNAHGNDCYKKNTQNTEAKLVWKCRNQRKTLKNYADTSSALERHAHRAAVEETLSLRISRSLCTISVHEIKAQATEAKRLSRAKADPDGGDHLP